MDGFGDVVVGDSGAWHERLTDGNPQVTREIVWALYEHTGNSSERFVQAELLTAALNVVLANYTNRCRNLINTFVHADCVHNDLVES